MSALIATSPAAFILLKTCRGLYLFWLGLNALRSKGISRVEKVQTGDQPLAKLFFKGVFANAINLKVILFFLSFLPQFVIPDNGKPGWQMAILGLMFTLQAAVLFGLLGYFSGAVGQWLNTRPGAGAILDHIASAVLIALGLRLLIVR